jgi:succinoglycan biosynthesis protein ExoA
MGVSSSNAVLIVIPTLNEAGTIGGVLAALRRGLPQRPLRFVVCDGGSSDRTAAVVEGLAAHDDDLHLLHNPRRLQSSAVNLAVERFGGQAEVLIRCDAHAVYPDGYVAQLVRSLDRHDADAVVVPLDSIGDTCVRRAVAWLSDSWIGSGGSAHRGGQRSGFVDHGHHAAFRLSSFVRAGGYDETFSHNEDAEFDCRQRALGGRIYLDASIRLRYLPRSSLGALWRQYFNYGAGRSRTARRHRGSLRLRQMAVPLNAFACLIALAALPLTAWTMLVPGVYAAALSVTSLAQVVRRRSLCALVCGPAAATMHFAWAAGFFWALAARREQPWDPSDARPLVPQTSGVCARAATL